MVDAAANVPQHCRIDGHVVTPGNTVTAGETIVVQVSALQSLGSADAIASRINTLYFGGAMNPKDRADLITFLLAANGSHVPAE